VPSCRLLGSSKYGAFDSVGGSVTALAGFDTKVVAKIEDKTAFPPRATKDLLSLEFSRPEVDIFIGECAKLEHSVIISDKTMQRAMVKLLEFMSVPDDLRNDV